MYNDYDFKRTNLKWFNYPEVQNAFKILRKIVSNSFDAF